LSYNVGLSFWLSRVQVVFGLENHSTL
jgi:hypothetical protein